jgi:hypothetical protein
MRRYIELGKAGCRGQGIELKRSEQDTKMTGAEES